MPLNPQQTEDLRGVIDERRRRLMAELRSDRQRARGDEHADLARDVGDAGDESVATLIADLDHADASRDLDELRTLEAARERLDGGSYGECIECGRDIAFERLRVEPGAVRCIDCQRLYEKTFLGISRPTL